MHVVIRHELVWKRLLHTKMSCKFLEPFFKVGVITAITPTFPTTWKKTRKAYSIFVFVLLTMGALASIKNRNFYEGAFFLKKFFLYINDLILVALDFHVLIAYNFWKKKQWVTLLNKLEITEKMTKVKKYHDYKRNIHDFTIFVVTHLLFLFVVVYGVIVWYRIEGLSVLVRVGVRAEEYINFFYLLLMCHLLYMLLMRYRGLNQTLSVYATKRFSDDVAKVTGYVVCYLRETVDVFNDLFGWPIFLIIQHTIMQLLIYVFAMVTNDQSYEALSLHICTVSFTLFMTTLFLFMCNSVTEENQKTVILSYKLRWAWQQVNQSQKQELYEFTNLVVRSVPVFTAANFFVVGKYTLIQILASVSSTLVILLQFNNK